MFVGRVIPNKKFEDVIRAFHAYRTRHNPRSRLLLVGSYSGFETLPRDAARRSSRTLGTPDVHFLGHVSNEELTALYDVADLFLCASEHEGFCVPIIEAFYKRRAGARLRGDRRARDDGRRRRALPAQGLRRDRPADGGHPDDAALEDAVVSRQDAALQRLQGRDFSGTLLRFRRSAAAEPARARRPTWPSISGRSYEQYERLEELRQVPGRRCYRALPDRADAR